MTASVYVAITIALTTISQLLQKSAALRYRQQASKNALAFYCREPRFWLALLGLGLGMLTWLAALGSIEISKAYALLSINYLLVPIAAAWLFSERLPPRGWLGAIALCIGVLLIGKS
ncbi:MAG TPA: EamA family transporter [Spongiibacteraceae bacterium]